MHEIYTTKGMKVIASRMFGKVAKIRRLMLKLRRWKTINELTSGGEGLYQKSGLYGGF